MKDEEEENINEDEKKDDDNDDEDFYGADEVEEKIMTELREKRLMQIKGEYKQNQQNKSKGHGDYREIKEEEFLPLVTGSKFVIVHFYHQDFERCKIIDMHLAKIAPTHQETLFLKLNVEHAPFFTDKLQLQVLPTTIAFIDGVAIDRITGFEELGGQDDFPTMNMIRRLVKMGVLKAKTKAEKGSQMFIKGNDNNSDDDYDSDY
jgi:thioredoxin-like negative regulator of GroEL